MHNSSQRLVIHDLAQARHPINGYRCQRVCSSHACFVLPATYLPTTTPDPFSWFREIQAIRKFDAFLSVYVIVATIALLVLFLAVKRLYRRRSWVYIEFRADIDLILQLRLYAFPNPTRNYSIRASNPSKLVLRSYCLFGVVLRNQSLAYYRQFNGTGDTPAHIHLRSILEDACHPHYISCSSLYSLPSSRIFSRV